MGGEQPQPTPEAQLAKNARHTLVYVPGAVNCNDLHYVYRTDSKNVISLTSPTQAHLMELIAGQFKSILKRQGRRVLFEWDKDQFGVLRETQTVGIREVFVEGEKTTKNDLTDEAKELDCISTDTGVLILSGYVEKKHFLYIKGRKYIVSACDPTERHFHELKNGTFSSIVERQGDQVVSEWQLSNKGQVYMYRPMKPKFLYLDEGLSTNGLTPEAAVAIRMLNNNAEKVVELSGKRSDYHYVYRKKPYYSVISNQQPTMKHFRELEDGKFFEIVQRKGTKVYHVWEVKDGKTSGSTPLEPRALHLIDENDGIHYCYYSNGSLRNTSDVPPTESDLKDLESGRLSKITKMSGDTLVFTWNNAIHYCYYHDGSLRNTSDVPPTESDLKDLESGKVSKITKMLGDSILYTWSHIPKTADLTPEAAIAVQTMNNKTVELSGTRSEKHFVYRKDSFCSIISDQRPSAKHFKELEDGKFFQIVQRKGNTVHYVWEVTYGKWGGYMPSEHQTLYLSDENDTNPSIRYGYHSDKLMSRVSDYAPSQSDLKDLEEGKFTKITKMQGNNLLYTWTHIPKTDVAKPDLTTIKLKEEETTPSDTTKSDELIELIELKDRLQKARQEYLDEMFTTLSDDLERRVRKGKNSCFRKTRDVEACIEMQKRLGEHGVVVTYTQKSKGNYLLTATFN